MSLYDDLMGSTERMRQKLRVLDSERARRVEAGVVRITEEHLQMLVMLGKCERGFASVVLMDVSPEQKKAALDMCREIRALRRKVEA